MSVCTVRSCNVSFDFQLPRMCAIIDCTQKAERVAGMLIAQKLNGNAGVAAWLASTRVVGRSQAPRTGTRGGDG